MSKINRRTFLEFLGAGAAVTLLGGFRPFNDNISFRGIAPSSADRIVLAKGLSQRILIKWDDPISPNDRFGFNNDYLAYLPFEKNNPDDGLLWVNHEYVDPLFVSGYTGGERTLEQIQKEMYAVGGSILRLKKDGKKWSIIKDDPHNRRLTANTEIPFNWPEPIAGSSTAIGTLGNCAGGVTPWGTILTCEENYDLFWGERDFSNGEIKPLDYGYGWHNFFDYPPEHYGWVVEVNPRSGEAQKHVALGRCAHECATVKELPDGRIVVYTGDDAINQCLYKFISSKPGSLTEGTLYVANTLMGKWMSLNYDEQPALQAKFKNQTEVLVRLREAARYVGGSPLDRPEDIEIDPVTGHVLIALTNNLAANPKNYHGSILKIEEDGGKYDSLTFTSESYLTGGKETGFACPDNLAFDPEGNLWFTSDISASTMHYQEYLPFKNNGLFVVPRNGKQAGEVIQMASAPVGAEFTGPYFSPDGTTLFLSVQHPGEYSTGLDKLTSHWPGGGTSIPRPAVVAISGFK